MTPEEDAYEEALRRIREAEATGATNLFLSQLDSLNQLPRELVALAPLQSLDLSWCKQLSGDLSPLASLTLLQSLNLSGCHQLSGDLSPLASLTSLQSLNLYGCEQLTGDLSPLARLISLQQLALTFSSQFSDLSPLADLNLLQTLDLSNCTEIDDLSPLAKLVSLRVLKFSDSKYLPDLGPLAKLRSLKVLAFHLCEHIGDLTPLATLTSLQVLVFEYCGKAGLFAPLKPLLPTLQQLTISCTFEDLPAEVCGKMLRDNILDKVRAHFADLGYGARNDAELKVFLLGNGGVGKTQLCRRLRGETFDEKNVFSTHGIQLTDMPLSLEGFPEPVRLNFWDFGGQEIYYGSHSLFLQGQAVFLILWTPAHEAGTDSEGDLTFRRRPLAYWLDYLRAFAGTDASVLIVQSQCDAARDRAMRPTAKTDDFSLRWLEVSAKTGVGLNFVKGALEEAVRDRFDRRPPPPIGAGRIAVRDRLRAMLEEDQKREPAERQHRLLERTEFDRICEEAGGVNDFKALLDFLHHNGVLFYRAGLFGDRIVLDQNWALEAIYAIFDRKKILPLLRGYGRFSRADLERLIWSGYTPEEQKVFLGMMESCGICFKVRELPNHEWEYLAPELLPEWSDAQEQLLGRLRDDPPNAEATARYVFLHEGVLRGYLSKLGECAKDAAIYWKYGCWFYEQKTRSQVLIESGWVDAPSEAGAGDIRFRAWGESAEELIDALLEELRELPVGQAPKIEQTQRIRGDKSAGLSQLQITDQPEIPPEGRPAIFVSYAWGDDSSDDAHQRTEVVDRLCERMDKDGWNILRDSNVLRSGDLISSFMKCIGLADHVIVVLSDKYLRSPYCMTELHAIYQRSSGEKEDFLRRIIPLVLADARFCTWRERLVYTKHWRAEFEEMELHFKDLGETDFRLYKAMQEWHNRIGDMLAYVNDKLAPHGFGEIVKDDFASLRQMIQQLR